MDQSEHNGQNRWHEKCAGHPGYQQNALIKAKWRKVTVRFEESFFKRLKGKLVEEGRTLQGYIDYLIRRDLEQDHYGY